VQVERALNEASAVFKKELWLKQEELQRTLAESLAVRERMARLTGWDGPESPSALRRAQLDYQLRMAETVRPAATSCNP